MVDKKKLAKAEGKSKEKAQKKADGANNQVKRPRPQVQATASQSLNRRDAKSEVNTIRKINLKKYF